MRKLTIAAVGLIVAAGVAAPASADNIRCTPNTCVASLEYTSLAPGSATQSVQIPVEVDSAGRGFVRNFQVEFGDGASASVDLLLDPDPGIIFGVGAVTGAFPAVFAFGFSTPIALSGTINAASSIGYSLTDGFLAGRGGTPGVTLTPFGVAGNTLVANDFFPATNKGVDAGPVATGGGGVCGPFVIATSACGPFGAVNAFAGGPFVLMGATVSFVLTDTDSAGLSGSVTQTAVPEPATLLLLGAGLLGVSRRRSSRR